MGLLDKFRTQPRWKSSSPVERIASVEALPLDQQDILVAIVREDRDPGVRIAALKKVLATSVVAAVARDDADERVREQATALLVDLATGEFEGTDEAESLAALAGLADAKSILAVARGAASEAVARAALDRLQDPGSLGSAARRSAHASVRLEALGRLSDEAEIAAVALRSDFRDVATAAVERLTSRGRLVEVASRAKNKTASKLARTLVREAEAAEEAAAEAARQQSARTASAGERDLADRQKRAAAVCARLENPEASALEEGEAVLDEADRAWPAFGMPADGAHAARYAAARDRFVAELGRYQGDREERARLAQATSVAVAARRAVCDGLDGTAGDDAPAQIEAARAAWAALEPCPDPAESDRWVRRFEDACRAAASRHRALVADRTRRERAADVCARIERLAEAPEFPRAREPWQALRRAWNELTAAGFEDLALAGRFGAADERLRGLEGDARERHARQEQERLARLQAALSDVEQATSAPDLSLKRAERVQRDARALLDAASAQPLRGEHELLAGRLREAMEALAPRVKDLRDLDDWQRWANAGRQEELCQRVERLIEVEDLAVAAQRLREAQAEWKQVASAPRDQSQVLWIRFKAACDAVRAKCDVHFAQVAETQAANQARKEELCVKAEALSASTDWIRTAEAIKALQAGWKEVGPAPRPLEKALWERFHAACDAFFTRRREDLRHRKDEWAANLAKKEALCARAEAVAETTEWQQGIQEIKTVQAEWKATGPVRKTQSEAVWQRLRSACDRFFERYQQRDQAALPAVVSDAEALIQEFEGLVPSQGDVPAAPEGLRERTAELRTRWIGLVGSLSRERAMRLGDRYTKAVARTVGAWPESFAGTDWDPEVNFRKMEDLCVQVERLLTTAGPAATAAEPSVPAEDDSPASVLARQLREALATNTIAGRPDEGPKWKAVADDLRSAQAAWKRIGPVPDEASRAIAARFQKACARASERIEQYRRGTGREAAR